MKTFKTIPFSKTFPDIVVYENQYNLTDGTLFQKLPQVNDFEGDEPLSSTQVTLISPQIQEDVKFSIFRAN